MNLKNVVVTAFAAVCTIVLLVPEGRAQSGSETKKGSWEKIKVHGKSLEGNLEGDSPDRDVFVYLPPGYATSPNRRVIMAALLSLNLGAAMIVGVASALGQCCIRANRKPRWFQIVFSTSAMALPILAAASALRFHLLLLEDPSGWLNLLAASLAYFFMNTIIVGGIVSLTSGRRLFHHWRESYPWTSLHYLAGGGIAGALHLLNVMS